MNEITEISNMILGLLSAGVTLRVVILLIKLSINNEEKDQIIKQIKNTIIFLICGLLVFQLKNIILLYY